MAKLPSTKTVAVHIVAVGENMYFPTCLPMSDVMDSFNFADRMGEMVFAFKNIRISLIVS